MSPAANNTPQYQYNYGLGVLPWGEGLTRYMTPTTVAVPQCCHIFGPGDLKMWRGLQQMNLSCVCEYPPVLSPLWPVWSHLMRRPQDMHASCDCRYTAVLSQLRSFLSHPEKTWGDEYSLWLWTHPSALLLIQLDALFPEEPSSGDECLVRQWMHPAAVTAVILMVSHWGEDLRRWMSAANMDTTHCFNIYDPGYCTLRRVPQGMNDSFDCGYTPVLNIHDSDELYPVGYAPVLSQLWTWWSQSEERTSRDKCLLWLWVHPTAAVDLIIMVSPWGRDLRRWMSPATDALSFMNLTVVPWGEDLRRWVSHMAELSQLWTWTFLLVIKTITVPDSHGLVSLSLSNEWWWSRENEVILLFSKSWETVRLRKWRVWWTERNFVYPDNSTADYSSLRSCEHWPRAEVILGTCAGCIWIMYFDCMILCICMHIFVPMWGVFPEPGGRWSRQGCLLEQQSLANWIENKFAYKQVTPKQV